MKSVISFIFLIIAAMLISPMPVKKEERVHSVTVLQINSNWNKKNSLPLHKLTNCNIEEALYEEQPNHIKKTFNKIPVIAIKKDGKPYRVWEGNIMFEPTVTVEKLQIYIDSLQ